jgi:hypothetical protein
MKWAQLQKRGRRGPGGVCHEPRNGTLTLGLGLFDHDLLRFISPEGRFVGRYGRFAGRHGKWRLGAGFTG